MAERVGLKRMSFLIIGQTIALLGTRFMAFGMGIWAYQRAGSVTDFAMITLAATIPGAFLSPIAGGLVDRWNRKAILLVARSVVALLSFAMAVLYWNNVLEVWHIAGLVMIQAIFAALVLPAISASVILMVNEDELAKANGLMGLSTGLINLLAPAIAGVMLTTLGMKAIFLINIPTMALGIISLLMTPIPQPTASDRADIISENIFKSISYAFKYLLQKRGLLLLMLFSSTTAFTAAGMNVLIIPLVLGFTDAAGLGMINSIAGSGMIFGSMLIMAWGGTTRKIHSIMGAAIVLATASIFAPIHPSIAAIALGGFIIMGCFPIIAVCSLELFQRKVAPEVQGRVFGMQAFVTGIATPLAILIVAPLADQIFEPMMAADGALLPYLGDIYGSGQGRGAAVMISLIGALSLLCVGLAALSPSIRRIDLDLPDLSTPKNAEESNTLQNEDDNKIPDAGKVAL